MKTNVEIKIYFNEIISRLKTNIYSAAHLRVIYSVDNLRGRANHIVIILEFFYW